ncbi:FAD-linked oxidase [Intrasporangium oryzae NRRL B-24470]|uniref:FAD-linked oxidase n=1 Tax=Intrasporangium oryzae NRRL B-24470 TaxID=1386089 RepID=W9G5M2_9MICO|nr:FAD-linked oxidase C-terminal domain-containing protein [Intrasporangium oryzae]EWT00078.1 FAD-linked oxidase [Intrasporangium oryzae NRRL B-24470]
MPTLPPGVAAREVTDPDVKRTYAADASPASSAPPSDYTVVRARDVADVVAVLEHAQANRTPVVPQGARTSRAGGAIATEGCIVLNVEALDAIIDVDPLEGYAVVGPGVVNAALKREVARAGLFYGPDPASWETCTIGGNVATNAGGLCCVKYGVTADWVKALQVVLPGGEVMRTGHRTAKGVAGYDLTGLVVGSEGTLGVVTEVLVRLAPAPDPALTALAVFASLDDAVAGIVALRRDSVRPSLLEILDRSSVRAVQAYGDYGFPNDCEAVLLVQSDRPGHAGEDVARYADLMAGAGATEVAVADDAQEADALLEGRRVMSTAFEALGARLAEDVCVPVARLADFIRGVETIAARHGVLIPVSGHGGDGNLHPSIVHPYDDPDALARAWLAFDEVLRLGLDVGGTITGEHGVGSLKVPWLRLELGADELDRQRRLKAVFDPLGIMNPGTVFERPR